MDDQPSAEQHKGERKALDALSVYFFVLPKQHGYSWDQRTETH